MKSFFPKIMFRVSRVSCEILHSVGIMESIENEAMKIYSKISESSLGNAMVKDLEDFIHNTMEAFLKFCAEQVL